jgi:hypothetical protein
LGKRVGVLIMLVILAVAGIWLGSQAGGSDAGRREEGEPIPYPEPVERLQVEVLNASGVSGIAREATGFLRDQGFDVVYYGNAGTYDQDPSVVIDRVGDPGAAQRVAGALGISGIRSEPDSTLLVHITVLLGPEWRAPSGTGEELDDPPPWWDLRRFFRKDEPEDAEHR